MLNFLKEMTKVYLTYDVEELYKLVPSVVRENLLLEDFKNIIQFYEDEKRRITIDSFKNWVTFKSYKDVFKYCSNNILGYLQKTEKPVSSKVLIYLISKMEEIDYRIELALPYILNNELNISCFETNGKVYIDIPFEYYKFDKEILENNFM